MASLLKADCCFSTFQLVTNYHPWGRQSCCFFSSEGSWYFFQTDIYYILCVWQETKHVDMLSFTYKWLYVQAVIGKFYTPFNCEVILNNERLLYSFFSEKTFRNIKQDERLIPSKVKVIQISSQFWNLLESVYFFQVENIKGILKQSSK